MCVIGWLLYIVIINQVYEEACSGKIVNSHESIILRDAVMVPT